MGQPIRIPLAEPLTNRDSTATKDSKLTNCFMQNVAGQPAVVKRPGTLLAVQDTVGQGQGTYCYNSTNYTIAANTLHQTNMVYGSDWTSSNAPWSGREAFGTVVFDNKIWIFGGIIGSSTDANDVWSSSDGVVWTQVTTSASWSPRHSSVYLVYAGRIWIIGGQTQAGVGFTDVWSSPDGITWTQATNSANFGTPLSGNTGVSFNGKMWVFSYSGTASNSWYSIDGITWTQASANIAVTPRVQATATAYNGKMWIISGYQQSPSAVDVNDAWYSTDGVTWTAATTSAPWTGRRFSSLLVFNNRMYIIAGYNSNVSPYYFNDVWSSSDGVTWVQTSIGTAFTARYGHGTAALNSTMFILGGVDSAGSLTNQVYNSTTASFTTTTYVVNTDYIPYQFSQVGGTTSPLLVLKNTNVLYTFNTQTNTLTKVTDPDYPTLTIPGIVYLDGTLYVADSSGKIYGSAIEDPTTWSALNYITAEIEPDGLVAIEKSLNYLVAFGQWTTEFFYDAGNPTGSPLSSVPNAFFTVGCASGTSIARMENGVIWMSQTIQRGRQIMVLDGFTPSVISTPEVDRILNADDLATVYSFSVKISGSIFYILTLKTSAKTLVYDFSTKQWHFWTSMTPRTAQNVTTITSASGVATVTETGHAYADGDLITIAGANEAAYNGSFNITYIDADTYTFGVPLGTTSPATGSITSVGYTESYFNAVAYSFCLGGDNIQGESDGVLYRMSPSYYDDNSNYINTKIKTVRIDGGESKRKFVSKAEIIGDKVAATGLLRYSDDDYTTWSTYRPIDMSAKRSLLTRQGYARRRAYEFRYVATQPLRVEALELDVSGGTS